MQWLRFERLAVPPSDTQRPRGWLAPRTGWLR
jgi:hypothetical protein